ncbi:TPA: ead/Ea22-like family protein [Citrobacter freundii]
MTAHNKQALREAAEKATPGEWKRMMRNSDELMTTFHGVAIGNVFVELTTGKRDIFDAEFIAAANPATVLALLDDLEAAEKRIAELEARTPYGYLRQCDGQIQISIGSEQPHNRSGGYATPWFAIYTASGIGVKGE